MNDDQCRFYHVPTREVQRTIPEGMCMYKGQGIMKTIIPVEHKQNNASNKTQANKNVKAHTFHKTDEMLSEEDGAQHCGLGRPDAAEIFVTERYQQEHRIWARQTCEGTEQCSDP